MSLSNRGDAPASNRLLREALALDTGFAAAWASMSVNYAMMRDTDSSRLTLLEALKRPERLNTAQRYRLEAEAAYRLRYDLAEAVRWYELHLEHAPQSISGHNNRGVYLSSLGRYEEALEEFRTAADIDPFGPAQAQVQLFNQVAILLALGRSEEAGQVSRQLTGPFAEYAALLRATAEGRWAAAESTAAGPALSPGAPVWFKAPAVTLYAGALAARGSVAAADRILQQAEAGAQRPASHWYRQARLVLALAGKRSAPEDQSLLRDTTPGGLTLWAVGRALRGDSTGARRALQALQRLPPVELLRLGDGPRLIQALLASRRARWQEVRDLLGPAAHRGEHDGSSPSQVASIATRWILADAYEQSGMLDSAASYLELAVAPTRVPFSHLALRGLAYPFAERRLASLYARMGDDEQARRRQRALSQ
jgi:tetratricopeptide (TPR) repeat protein